jgi:hypothetical protein
MSMEWVSIVGSGFILATVFWAGNTYNRISAIERSLAEIRESIPALADIAVLRVELQAVKVRVDHLEAKV